MEKILSNLQINDWIQKWIHEEKTTSLFGVLSTVGLDGVPKARIVSVREIDEKGILFFTQQGSEKVKQIEHCHQVCMTLFLPDNRRQISFEGKAVALDEKQNDHYWSSYPKIPQTRFLVYGPRSGEKIESNDPLDEKLKENLIEYQDQVIQRPESYIGYQIIPSVVKLYQLNLDRISDSYILTKNGDKWPLQRVVP